MDKYRFLKRYWVNYTQYQGKAEHDGCFPNLILWLRLAIDDDAELAADLLEMDDDEREEFYSWGHNSRWAHIAEPIINDAAFANEDWSDRDRAWLKEMLISVAEQYGDPDVEEHYFKHDKKDEK